MKYRITFFAVLMMALAIPQSVMAQDYDFSALAPNGQTLYYSIIDASSVSVVQENHYYPYYTTYPTGDLVIPSSVTDGSTTYSVTSIGNYAFWDCSGLTSVTIPEGVTSIGNHAFYDCSGLTSVTIPSNVTFIGFNAFAGCSGLTSVTIPSSVTYIGNGAFSSCSGLTSVTIPNGVTSIVYETFAGCSGLTSVTIPSGVTSIGDFAFRGCSSLTSVTIPEGVTSICRLAFWDCSGLTSIECLAMVPPTMGTNVFYNVPTNIPVYVPCGKVADYQAANGWSSFDNIQEICGTPGITGVSVYADGNDIVVEGAAGNTVTLYDNGGNTLSTSTAPTGTPLRFEGLASGTYYVKIGVLPARMKVEVR